MGTLGGRRSFGGGRYYFLALEVGVGEGGAPEVYQRMPIKGTSASIIYSCRIMTSQHPLFVC